MAGCEETTLRLKWHVLHNHAPGIFDEDITHSEWVSNRRYAALSILEKSLNGPIALVEDLVELLNNFQLIGEAWEIQANQEEAMKVMCQVMNWPLQESFSLTPINSLACLIYWRALTALLQNLSPNVRQDLQKAFSSQQANDVPAPVGDRDAEHEQSPEPAPGRQMFDSHFYLYRLQRFWGCRMTHHSYRQWLPWVTPLNNTGSTLQDVRQCFVILTHTRQWRGLMNSPWIQSVWPLGFFPNTRPCRKR